GVEMKHSVQILQPTLPPTLLSSQQQIYHSLARTSNDAMVIAAPVTQSPSELTIVYVNEAFTRLTGYLADDVTGEPLTFLSGCSATTNSLARMWQGIAEGRAISQPWRCVTKKGDEQETELSLIPFADTTGLFSFLVTIYVPSAPQPAASFDSAGL